MSLFVRSSTRHVTVALVCDSVLCIDHRPSDKLKVVGSTRSPTGGKQKIPLQVMLSNLHW